MDAGHELPNVPGEHRHRIGSDYMSIPPLRILRHAADVHSFIERNGELKTCKTAFVDTACQRRRVAVDIKSRSQL
jgi:hypothetical protein